MKELIKFKDFRFIYNRKKHEVDLFLFNKRIKRDKEVIDIIAGEMSLTERHRLLKQMYRIQTERLNTTAYIIMSNLVNAVDSKDVYRPIFIYHDKNKAKAKLKKLIKKFGSVFQDFYIIKNVKTDG